MDSTPPTSKPADIDAVSTPAEKERTLPFSRWWPVLSGALFGVVLRLIFSGKPDGAYTAMSSAFIYLAPAGVGAVTVSIAESYRRRTWGFYLWAPMVANLFFVLGTLAILIEGIICAVLVIPLFCLLASAGGLIMGVVCRTTRQRRGTTYGFAALPILLAALPIDDAGERHIERVERTVAFAAPAETVWRQIHDARDIRAEEVDRAWMYRIGVPLPVAGVTHKTANGSIRKVEMGKSIHFEQVATAWEENKYVRWTYRFDKDSFPPNALDDHVQIGGRYFDLIDTSYTLSPLATGETALKISMSYRVSTQFNWYVKPLAEALIANFEEVILEFYRGRAMRLAEKH